MVAVERGSALRQNRSRSRRRRRGGATLLFALVLLGVGLWSGYWYAAYRVADSAVQNGSAADAALTCGDRELAGFPFNLTLICRDFAAAANGIVIRAGAVDARAPLYRPGHVAARLAGPFEFDAPAAGITASANWTDAEAVVDAGLGGVTRAAADFVSLDMMLGGPIGQIRIAADRFAGSVAPASGETDAIGLDFVADSLRLGPLPSLSGEGTVHFLGAGSAIGPDVGALISSWLRAGARMQIANTRLAAGKLTVWADGPLSVEDDGSLSGQLTVRFTGSEGLPDLVAAILPGLRSAAEELATGILALSRRIDGADGADGADYEVRLTLDHSQVNVGFIPVLTLPSLASR